LTAGGVQREALETMSYVPMLRSMSGAALGDQGEDMDAIAQYMAGTSARTAAATKAQDAWKVWYDGVSWWNKNYDRPTYDHARNLRNAFDLANATTAAEQTQVQQVIKTGLTTEEMTGGPTRITSGGTFSEKDGGVTPPMPLWGKFAIGIAVVGLGVYGLHELRLFTSLFKKAPKKAS
jgi:hypothetical protein